MTSTKTDSLNRIADKLKLDRPQIGKGSTDPASFLRLVGVKIGLDDSQMKSKSSIVREILYRVGTVWNSEFDSSQQESGGGGIITAQGLAAVADAVEFIMDNSQEPTFDVRPGMESLMSSGQSRPRLTRAFISRWASLARSQH